MTEKRFDWDMNGIFDYENDDEDYISEYEDLSDLLNEQEEEISNLQLIRRVNEKAYRKSVKEYEEFIEELEQENEQLKDILKDITIQLDANHTMNTYQMVIPINRVIYNELNRRLKETSFNEELRRFLDD